MKLFWLKRDPNNMCAYFYKIIQGACNIDSYDNKRGALFNECIASYLQQQVILYYIDHTDDAFAELNKKKLENYY